MSDTTFEQIVHALTFGNEGLWMSRTLGSDRSKALQVVNGQVVARQMEHSVLKGTCMSIAQNEAITAPPLGVAGRIGHDLLPKQMCHGSTSHGCSGVPTICCLWLISTDGSDCIDAFMLQRGALVLWRHGFLNKVRRRFGGDCLLTRREVQFKVLVSYIYDRSRAEVE